MKINNYNQIKRTLPPEVKLVAVSKFQPVENIMTLYNVGQRCFGENRPLELRDKHVNLPKDIEWHFIGNLQTNKIKYIISYVSLIHSIATSNLMLAVDKEAEKVDRVVDVLIEFHVAREESKHGFSIKEAKQFLASTEFSNMKHIRIVGVMAMASLTSDMDEVRTEFKTIKSYFDELKNLYFADAPWFKKISMGMSHDYTIAVEEGATMVRIGTAIFAD